MMSRVATLTIDQHPFAKLLKGASRGETVLRFEGGPANTVATPENPWFATYDGDTANEKDKEEGVYVRVRKGGRFLIPYHTLNDMSVLSIDDMVFSLNGETNPLRRG